MKTLSLSAVLIALALLGCKPRSYNTTSSANSSVAVGEFELAADPQPDRDFD